MLTSSEEFATDPKENDKNVFCDKDQSLDVNNNFVPIPDHFYEQAPQARTSRDDVLPRPPPQFHIQYAMRGEMKADKLNQAYKMHKMYKDIETMDKREQNKSLGEQRQDMQECMT